MYIVYGHQKGSKKIKTQHNFIIYILPNPLDVVNCPFVGNKFSDPLHIRRVRGKQCEVR